MPGSATTRAVPTCVHNPPTKRKEKRGEKGKQKKNIKKNRPFNQSIVLRDEREREQAGFGSREQITMAGENYQLRCTSIESASSMQEREREANFNETNGAERKGQKKKKKKFSAASHMEAPGY